MKKRIYNFSAGPAILPEDVLKEAQEELFSYKDAGMSVMEMSHRSKSYDEIHMGAQADLKKLLDIGDNYEVLFLQGGATLQFSMVPFNLMIPSKSADYIMTGSWSKKALKEAKRVGQVNIAATSEDSNFNRIPKQSELTLNTDAS
jgi:phosphoserine aminotransferase